MPLSRAETSAPFVLPHYAELRRMAGFPNTYCPFFPHPKQAYFLINPKLELLYGGAGYGGKSVALLMAALQYVHVPGYNALIFRRAYTDLARPEGIMSLAHKWLHGTDAKWNNETHTYTFPSGATLGFGYMAAANDHYNYQGGSYQFLGFDEVTQFQLFQYNFMFGWLRRTQTMSEQVPLRVRATTNPVGRGVTWVYNRFVKQPVSATHEFIPALYTDNPYGDQAAYTETLSRMDRTMRARIGEGQWNVQDSGGMFRVGDFKRCRLADVPQGTEKVRYWDLASTMPTESNPDPDWTVGLRMEHLDGRYFITDVQRDRLEPYETEQLMRRTAQQDGYDVEQHVEQEPGSSGKITLDHIIRVVLNGYSVEGHRETGDKVSRARTFAAAANNGNVFIVDADWADEYIDECVGFPDGDHDDQVDCCAGAHRALNNVVHGGAV